MRRCFCISSSFGAVMTLCGPVGSLALFGISNVRYIPGWNEPSWSSAINSSRSRSSEISIDAHGEAAS